MADNTDSPIEKAARTGNLLAVLKAAARGSLEIGIGLVDDVLPPAARALRILKAVDQGTLLAQLAGELADLERRGKVKPDYFNSAQARDCLAELLAFVDREVPDHTRQETVKKVFLMAATEHFSTREDPLPQQMMKLAMTLTAGEILVLAAASASKGVASQSGGRMSVTHWAQNIANASGLKYAELVLLHEENLTKKKLLVARANPHDVFSSGPTDRLTHLGVMLCQFIATEI